jgi:hypothetical protein
MKLLRRLSIPFLFFAILLSACGGAPVPETSQIDVILTEGVKTMVASYFATQTALAPAATATVPSATVTPSPAFTPVGFLNNTLTPTFIIYPTLARTSTATVTGTPPTATVNSPGLAFGCNNLAFLYDINYPSGSVLKPGENFTKTWKVQNSGSCEWKSYYRLTFLSGDEFDAPSISIGKIIPVGKNPEISINLDAPRRTGTFTAYWRMSDGEGHMFGATLGVTIKVQGDPTDTPAPSATLTPTITFTPGTPATTTTP